MLTEPASRSTARAGDAEPDAHEVGAAGEYDRLVAFPVLGERPPVLLDEADEPPERLDPLPLVPGGDPGVENAPGLARGRPAGVALLQHATGTQHRDAIRLAVGGGLLLELVHAGDDLLP